MEDSYCRELAREKLSNGAERPPSKRKWKYFDRMDFLRDTIYRKKKKIFFSELFALCYYIKLLCYIFKLL